MLRALVGPSPDRALTRLWLRGIPSPMGEGSLDTSDADLAAVTPSAASGFTGGIVMVAGALQTLLGVQTFDMLRMQGTALGAALLLLVLGVPNLVLGWNVRKVRGWAAQWGFVLAGAAGLMDLGWAVFLVLSGFFSPLAFVLVPINLAAAVMAYGRLKPGKAADAARRRLAQQGFDAGM